MTGSKKSQSPAPRSGEDAFAGGASLAKKLATEMLLRMIGSAADYRDWDLSEQDGARLVKLIKQKQRIICSAFAFQMKQHFAEFKSGENSNPEKSATDWQQLGLSGSGSKAEIKELQGITSRYGEAFKEFDRSILKRLQTAIKRSRASIYENPLQVKRLCESFRYAIDSLNLDSRYKVALYRLFADRFVESLGPFYRQVDHYLLDSGMLPELEPARIHLRSIEGLSPDRPPAGFEPDPSLPLLILLQSFKEKSRQKSASLANLFPELKKRFSSAGITKYDDQIEQLNLIFKLIFEDEDLPAQVKHELARLQIYVFITAIQEKGFLKRSSNPARRLLEGIINSEVEIANSGRSEQSGIRYIREQIDEMASLQFITVDSYSQMLEGYRNYLKKNETDTRRARRIEAAKKLLPVVKSRLNEITQPLRIQGTPLIVFEKVWSPLLVQIALHRGMDSGPWHKTIEMVKKQVWSMIPKSTPEEKQELLKTLPQVEHSLHRAMRSLKLADSLQKSLRDYFKLEQQNVVEQTTQNISDAKRKTRSLGEQSFAGMEDTTDFDAMMQTGVFQVPTEMIEAMDAAKAAARDKPKKVNQVEALKTGDWVNLQQSGQKVLAKVAWKAEDSSLFIFVDRDGTRICELNATELGEGFDMGSVTLCEEGTLDAEKNQYSFMKTI
jgi:hypothetical protein